MLVDNADLHYSLVDVRGREGELVTYLGPLSLITIWVYRRERIVQNKNTYHSSIANKESRANYIPVQNKQVIITGHISGAI